MIEYDLPGEPHHPADLLLGKIEHERQMKEIREMDIEQWVREIQA